MTQNNMPQSSGSGSKKWLTAEQHRDLLLAGKGTALGILFVGIISTFAPPQWGTSFIKIFALIAIARVIYIFLPFRNRIRDFSVNCIETYKGLTTEQKLYANAILLTATFFFVLFIGGTPLTQGYVVLLLGFYGYVAFHDIYRWYKALSEHLFGKAVIGITFAAASNFAYSAAGQEVAQIIHVVPTNFTRTMLFIAIAMIPVLLIFAGGIVFVASISISSLIMIPSMLGNIGPQNKATEWLFAGTLKKSTLRFNLATRLFQIIFYGAIGYNVFTSGQHAMAWYEQKLSSLAPQLIYSFDMYEGKECKLDAGYKLAALGDAKFLIAKRSSSGDISFDPPVKCDNLPAH